MGRKININIDINIDKYRHENKYKYRYKYRTRHPPPGKKKKTRKQRGKSEGKAIGVCRSYGAPEHVLAVLAVLVGRVKEREKGFRMVRLDRFLRDVTPVCSLPAFTAEDEERRQRQQHGERERDGVGEAEREENLTQELTRVMREVTSTRLDFLDGLEVFQTLQESVLLPTGVDSLDRLLGGGLREGQVTEFFGSSPSGKTQICHCIAACAAWLDFRVVYLTSNGSFSSERLVKLSSHVLSQMKSSGSHAADAAASAAAADSDKEMMRGNLEKILTNVNINQVSNSLSLVSIFQSMLENFEYLVKHGKTIPKVVIVDSPSLFLYRDLTVSQPFGRLLIVQLASAMRCLATKFNIAIVITNHEVRNPFTLHTSGGGGGDTAADGRGRSAGAGARTTLEPRPGLGQTWCPQVNVRVHLKMFKYRGADPPAAGAEATTLCRATLVKASTCACGREAWMKVCENNITGTDVPAVEDDNIQDISVWH